MLCALYCAFQATVHIAKYFNIMEFNDQLLDDNTYDKGCFTGTFSDTVIAKNLKAGLCNDGADSDCLEKGSNWTFVIAFNGWTFAALTLNFLIIATGACNSYLRVIGGIMFCLTGLAHLFAIYQTYMHRLVGGHFGELCEINMDSSYLASGLLSEFDNVPMTYAEDAQLLLALLFYQVAFIPICIGVGLGPLCRRKPLVY